MKLTGPFVATSWQSRHARDGVSIAYHPNPSFRTEVTYLFSIPPSCDSS